MEKKLKTIISLLFLGVFLISVYPNNQKKMDDTRHIDLEQRDKGTRSGSATEVAAYIDGDMITVETTNYADSPILVEIFDDYAAFLVFAESACGSYVVMDISSLPPGKYEIVVTLDYRYTGSFER